MGIEVETELLAILEGLRHQAGSLAVAIKKPVYRSSIQPCRERLLRGSTVSGGAVQSAASPHVPASGCVCVCACMCVCTCSINSRVGMAQQTAVCGSHRQVVFLA